MNTKKKKNSIVYKKGELIMFEDGDYSDYRVELIAKALKKFGREDSILEWAKDTGRYYDENGYYLNSIFSHEDLDKLYGYGVISKEVYNEQSDQFLTNFHHYRLEPKDDIGFVPWLLKNGYIEEVECKAFDLDINFDAPQLY